MACECEQISCGECTPPCTPPITPTPTPCEDPVYTSNGCAPGQHTNCISLDNTSDACIPLVQNSNLTVAINNIKSYIKSTFTRLTAFDASVQVVQTDDACDDKARIGVRIDPNVTNKLLLNPAGLFVAPATVVNPGDIAILIQDTNTIDLVGNGTTATPLSANLRIDSVTAGNTLTQGVNGAYVPTPAVITSNNGLTKTVNNIQLGGPLIKDTLIDSSAFKLSIQNDVGIGIVPSGAAGARPRLSVSRNVIPNNEGANYASTSALEFIHSGEISSSTLYGGLGGLFGFGPAASRTLLPNTHYSGLIGTVATQTDFAILGGMLSSVSAVSVFLSQTVGAFGTHGKLSKYAGFRVATPNQDASNPTKEFGGIEDVYGLYIEDLRVSLNTKIDRSWGVYQVGASDHNFFAANIFADKLKTISVPPVTTGTRKMVVSDQNGLLSSGAVTGFAVTGNTRTSEFGSMEFFSTLTLANASAVAGETVLIYNNTVENLTVKAGVNYQGIGVHSVGNLTGNFVADGNSCFISNLTFLNLNLTGFTEIDCSNVQFDGVHSISTNASVNNAVFIGGSGRSLSCNTVSKLSNCMVYCSSTFVDNINVTNCRFIDKSANVPSSYFVEINNTTGGSANNYQLIFSHNYIESENNQGLYLITRAGTDIRSIVSNNTIKTNTKTAAYVHIGGIIQNEAGTLFSNNTISNYGPDAALVLVNVSTTLSEPARNLSHNSIVGNNAYSVSGAGIQSILCGMKNCHGYSENSFGILIDSQEQKSSEVRLIDCTGESKASNGLRALRDIYIIGGTYISSKNASDGNPIYISNISQNSVVTNLYFIAGVKTLAYNTLAYGIVSAVALTVKISGCIFSNERIAFGTPVLGVHDIGSGGNITFATVTIDAYGNIR